MKTKILLLFLLLFPVLASAQEDKKIFNRYVDFVKSKPADKLFTETALFFLHAPYKGGTLEGNTSEEVVVNLREFDCTTFVETCIALFNTVCDSSAAYDEFIENLEQVRYRYGVVDGYTSRLHYATDWITDNTLKGIIDDYTLFRGGKHFNVYVDYMSAHPQSYPALKDSPKDVAKMKKIEQEINERNTYYYIPQKDIPNIQQNILTGDIIFFTTSVAGLDVTHAGIAYRTEDKLTFVHASSKHGKVIINPEPLTDYCSRIKNNTGIMIVRVK